MNDQIELHLRNCWNAGAPLASRVLREHIESLERENARLSRELEEMRVIAEEMKARRNERFCIVSDDDGHRWICPMERRAEFIQWLKDVAEYWSGGMNAKPDDIQKDFLSWEGESLTFCDPVLE